MSYIHQNKAPRQIPVFAKKRKNIDILPDKFKTRKSSYISKNSKGGTPPAVVPLKDVVKSKSDVNIDTLQQSVSFSAMFVMMKNKCMGLSNRLFIAQTQKKLNTVANAYHHSRDVSGVQNKFINFDKILL
jgi:hypothetical protein